MSNVRLSNNDLRELAWSCFVWKNEVMDYRKMLINAPDYDETLSRVTL